MIHASTQQARPKANWKDYVFNKEDYSKVVSSGMAWVVFPDWPTPQEFEEYLNKEKGEKDV